MTAKNSNQLLAQHALSSPQVAAPCSLQHGGGPLYFGHTERPLFGWLHAASEADLRGIGLVVCNPFGNEAICAHRSIRHLCEQSARAGIPALRFDYDGTGDSAGHDHDPRRVDAWIDSIHSAADELKRSAGLERLCLLGFRLGAALGALAAARRDDVTALIAIAPVVTGRIHLREMKLMQRAMEAKSSRVRDARDDTFESIGFVLSPETLASLGTLNLNTLERAPAANVLVLDRAELPGDARWPAHLQETGARVDRRSVPGYTEMMLDSHESVVPREMLETAVDWMREVSRRSPVRSPAESHSVPSAINAMLAAPPPQRASLPHSVPHDAVTGPSPAVVIQEHAVQFGSSSALFGIVSAPEEDSNETGNSAVGKAVLLLNSGAVHRIGPNRLHVALARHLAKRGYTVLRMDMAGLGDSTPRPGEPENEVYSRHALEDVRAGIEYLRNRWNVTDVRAVGLCSGAFNSFKAAVARLPLTGVVLINPLTFSWTEGMSLKYPEHRVAADIMRYRTNALRLAPWLKLLRGQVDLTELSLVLLRKTQALALTPLRAVARTVRIPLRNDLPSELNAIVGAGIRLNFVFAENDPGQELLSSLGGPTARRLRNRGAIGVQIVGGADHTFTDRAARAMLVAALAGALSEPV